ncbi:hypothetical protein M0Q97_10245 [Candidatus Dojkabacteria bacterium]|jgi:hypothetical protein|nr:hypothetical protein [Candidatus Dojkabacteria bacterium]
MTFLQALENVSDNVIKDAKTNLRNKNHIATGSLRDSLNYTMKQNKNGVTIAFGGNDYSEWVDQGRKPGKGIPVDILKNWLKLKRLDTSLSYVINKKIREKGIDPTYFYTNALNENIPAYDDAVDAYFDEIEAEFDIIFS